jgi:xylulokinase
VKKHETDTYQRIYKWLDVKEFLILKCTDQFVMTRDSAYATLLYDVRSGGRGFSKKMCRMLKVALEHLPQIVNCTDQVGQLTGWAAEQLGLKVGTPVFGGGGDASLIGVGAGAAKPGSTHIYSGTSGWVSTVVKKRKIDLKSMIASIVGANHNTYNYFAELETASKCLEWVKDHLALDEINIYLQKVCISDSLETIYVNLYDFMLNEIKEIPAGSHGVIFTPWLHGNRCPFEDSSARGMFFNISLETGKRDLIHAVMEGICYHLRWQLEAQKRKVMTSSTIRFVGGGALAPLTCQTIADILGCEIETVENPQNVGALGAAVVVAVGLGLLESVEDANKLIRPKEIYYPNPVVKSVHDRNFQVFKSLYKNNKKAFYELNNK